MTGPVSVASWEQAPSAHPEDRSALRLWRAFATARAGLGAALLVLLAGLAALEAPAAGATTHTGLLAAGAGYVAMALALRRWVPPPPRDADLRWAATLGVDLAAVAALEFFQAGGLNYSPLFAVPVLMAAVLARGPLAVGTAAAASLLMLLEAGLLRPAAADGASRVLQAGVTGIGFFALALLAHQLAVRLARAEQRASQGQQAARLQARVNALVIETLGDGILVVDIEGRVRAANPTACALLGVPGTEPGFSLAERPAWQVLVELAQQTLLLGANQRRDITLEGEDGASLRLFARTRMASGEANEGGGLCVVFLQDLREMEARLRTERLAAMGRMSAAVAHEIRNPLAAIAQANALLDEDLRDPQLRQLTALVGQNARRLAQIVEEVLDVARAKQQPAGGSAPTALDQEVGAACGDWSRQARSELRLAVSAGAGPLRVPFEPEHLRRVLVNLLDNALRYAGQAPDSIQVATRVDGGRASLQVWSDGRPLEPAVQRHLFEPFFSSESRSSGLGLYICRELCERHGATIEYRRAASPLGQPREGNAFVVRFAPAPAPATISA